jgi:hypothetical protein
MAAACRRFWFCERHGTRSGGVLGRVAARAPRGVPEGGSIRISIVDRNLNVIQNIGLPEVPMGTKERRQREVAEREQLFIDKARDLVCQEGLLQLQMGRLAEACDFSRQAVTHLWQGVAIEALECGVLELRAFDTRAVLTIDFALLNGRERSALIKEVKDSLSNAR